MSKVSVIITVYNGEAYVREAIDSILNQTFQDFELVIVNDASTDDTGNILNNINDPRIHVITNNKKTGPSQGRNIAIEKSSGEYIAIMDADDISLPQRLELQVKFLNEHEDIGIVGSNWVEIDDDGTSLRPVYFPQDNESIQVELLKRNCFCHSSVMYRKSIFQHIGGYRTEFEVSEDYDLYLRFAEVTKVQNLSDILCKHRLNPISLSIDRKKIDRYHSLACALTRERRAGKSEDIQFNKQIIFGESESSAVSNIYISNLFGRIQRTLTVSRYYYGSGCYYLYNGDIIKARRFFGKCLRSRLLHIRGFFLWLLCCLPSDIVNRIIPLFQNVRKSFRKS